MEYFNNSIGKIYLNNTRGPKEILNCPYVYEIPSPHIFGAPNFMGIRKFNFPLYKMIPKLYADSFFEDGTIRLGTLVDFAREDIHGTAIGDFREGFLSTSVDMKNGKRIIHIISSINSYVYSTCIKYDDNLMKSFGADSVIQINSLDFFAAITQTISEIVDVSVIAPIDYYSDKSWSNIIRLNIEGKISSRMVPRISHVKDKIYSHQNEVRCIWEAKTPDMLKNNPNLSTHCSIKSELYQNKINSLREETIAKRIKPLIIKVPKARFYANLV